MVYVMEEPYRPTKRGPEWLISSEGISVVDAGRRSSVSWDDLTRVEVDTCKVTLYLPGRRSMTIGQRWTGSLPPSSFIAAVRSFLPQRLLDEAVDEALRCAWGWSRAVELGRAESCLRCGGTLQRVAAAELHGSFGAVEAVLRDVDRRVCGQCEAAFPVDEDQMGDLLFDVIEQLDEPGLDWSEGFVMDLHERGFRRRPRGDIRVRVADSLTVRPVPGDVHLAVLNALCGESPPGLTDTSGR